MENNETHKEDEFRLSGSEFQTTLQRFLSKMPDTGLKYKNRYGVIQLTYTEVIYSKETKHVQVS